MRCVTKRPEPPSLTTYRLSTPHPDWDGYGDKRTAQAQLCQEQHGLCCFCQRRIRPDEQPSNDKLARNMKVAHFVPRNSAAGRQNPRLEVTWSNLFGVCMGGEGRLPTSEQHCDTMQGNTELNPRLDPGLLRPETVKFRPSGHVYSDEPSIDHDLNHTLNLNALLLKDQRIAARDALFQSIDSTGHRHFTASMIQRRIDQLEREQLLAPFCDYLLFILRKRLRSDSAA